MKTQNPLGGGILATLMHEEGYQPHAVTPLKH